MSNEIIPIQEVESLYAGIRLILSEARQRSYNAINFAMVQSYWQVGRQIVEHEQQGEVRASYGKGILKELAIRLTKDFGKGLDESNIRYLRLFYTSFPIRLRSRTELM